MARQPHRLPLIEALRAAGVAVLPMEGPATAAADGAAAARSLARDLDGLPPAGAVVAVGPPWWLGIAAQARRAALESAPPPWVLLPTPEPAGTPPGRDAAHVRAWLATQTLESADWVGPVRPASEACLPDAAAGDVLGWLESLRRRARTGSAEAGAAGDAVGVVLVHRDRPAWVKQAIDSLAAQTRPPDRLVVVDAASTDPLARLALRRAVARFATAPAVLIERTDSSLGAARSAGVAALETDWVLFMDDDNVAPAEALAVFARAAGTGAAAVWTCWAALFSGSVPPPGLEPAAAPLYAPLGPVPGLLARRNELGDANLLIRRDVYTRLGGFDPDPTTGAEDWDLLVRAWLAGFPHRVIPRPLVWKRLSPGSMSASMDRERARRRVLGRLRGAGLPV